MPAAGERRTEITTPHDVHGLRATVMGLGLHGGGLAAAQFLIRHGAHVTVTDLRDETVLAPSLDQLAGPVRLVLGCHREHDFTTADLVIKNPAVPSHSRFLNAAREAGTPVENDISLFCRLHPETPVLAVTGSKGKSTTAAALHHALRRWHPDACLGGNITVSPLVFADRLAPGTPVVLELSSWQLGDLPDPAVLRARVAIITNILPDHQDRYPSMRAYAADKLRVFTGQRASDRALLGAHTWRWVERPPAARVWHVADGTLRGAGLPGHAGAEVDGGVLRLCAPDVGAVGALELPAGLLPGRHNLLNLAAAALGAAALVGVRKLPAAVAALADFGGLEHRLEHVAEWRGIHIVNDSAATMPHATAAALAACQSPVTLIAGGNDKELEFGALRGHLARVASAVLLAGTATGKLAAALADGGVAIEGPFDDLRDAVRAALAATAAGGTLLFSPGATSFGMFAHEFERGAAFKQAVHELTGTGAPPC